VVLSTIELPVPFAPHNHKFQSAVAAAVVAVRTPSARPDADEADPAVLEAVEQASAAVFAHPVHDCPDRAAHLAAAARLDRARRDVEDLGRQVRARTESLARRFDRVLRLLEAWGYLDGWELTEKGSMLAALYHECDLLVAECVHEGLFDDLDPPSVAGLASVFGYEHRSQEAPPAPWYPSARVRRSYQRIEVLSRELEVDESAAGLPLTRPPDPTFLALAHAWAAGEELGDVLEHEDVTAGDFVRVVRQLIDLLRQIALIATNPATARAARQAATALHRGVVAVSAAVDEPDEATFEVGT
jgi:ATP-dependent RNA helicase HelY